MEKLKKEKLLNSSLIEAIAVFIKINKRIEAIGLNLSMDIITKKIEGTSYHIKISEEAIESYTGWKNKKYLYKQVKQFNIWSEKEEKNISIENLLLHTSKKTKLGILEELCHSISYYSNFVPEDTQIEYFKNAVSVSIGKINTLCNNRGSGLPYGENLTLELSLFAFTAAVNKYYSSVKEDYNENTSEENNNEDNNIKEDHNDHIDNDIENNMNDYSEDIDNDTNDYSEDNLNENI